MDSFTAQDWILILGAVGILINNVVNNWKMSGKVDAINATAKVIEGHVNSATTKADERQQAAADREKALLETIAELKRNSSLLAQALAIKEAGRSIRNTDVIQQPQSQAQPEQRREEPEPRKEVAADIKKTDIKTLADNLEIKPKEKK